VTAGTRAGWLLILAATPALAQRAPVLQQIKLPHAYYFREMYLPQVTSGPSAVTWSPDGTEIIYAMQGSLWRQRLGATDAEQLTAGPGYDFQPDWSPDGKTVAYVSYRDDAEELFLLDLASGASRPLTTTRAVNVEPRWSPDGTRLAYVSTAYEGRFHIFVLRVGSDSAPRRMSADTNSGLPRYYYSVYDHYLSPTWSPDGTELMYVSNHGHVWGTGGIWRGTRLVHDEETTWKARPDWSRDGRRVVYSSYAGRQWNQLWLMTADGSNALQLTYGDYDATAPRWSRDGSRIAYVVNQGGNTALRVIDLPGGRVTPVVIGRRHYRVPIGVVELELPFASRVSVTGADGRSFAPDDAWRYADDSFDRRERRFEIGYFQGVGRQRVTVPAGSVTVHVMRGLEHAVVTRTVVVRAGDTVRMSVSAPRIATLPGWTSGDLHVHMNYGGTYRNDPAHLATQARAEDLDVVESLIVNKEGRVPDVGYFTGRPDVASPLIVQGQEYHTSYWGHTGLLGLREHLLLPGYAAYTATPAASLWPTNTDVARRARAQGALAGYVHPFDVYPDPADTTVALTNELPVGVALGTVDYMEIVAFSDHLATARVWYQLLNCGFRIPAGAGTDAMANFASLRGPVGLDRVYVKAPATSHGAWLAALAGGRSFATNGPLVTFTMDGHGIGDAIRLAHGRTMTVEATLRSIVPVDHFELVSGGQVVASATLTGDHTTARARWVVPVTQSGWYTVRAYSDHATSPILDIYPFATTSPIYVTVAGQPVRSSADAAYFVRWIDRLDAGARAFTDWNTPAERDSVLAEIARARAEFQRR
jgi:TolB protein